MDGFGWEWIFFINIPVGVVAFVLAWMLVPNLPTNPHRFDIVGVFLSAIGLFLIVFGLQEGEHYDWGVIWGPITVWGVIITGVLVMGVFIWTQARTKNEPLVPLPLFKDRNFGVANIAIADRGLHGHEHVAAAHVLHPARPRPDADPVGAAADPHGRALRACSRPSRASCSTAPTRGSCWCPG